MKRRRVIIEYVTKTTADMVIAYPAVWTDADLRTILLQQPRVVGVELLEETDQMPEMTL